MLYVLCISVCERRYNQNKSSKYFHNITQGLETLQYNNQPHNHALTVEIVSPSLHVVTPAKAKWMSGVHGQWFNPFRPFGHCRCVLLWMWMLLVDTRRRTGNRQEDT